MKSKPQLPYKAIFFDAGGTLLRVHPSVGHIYARIAKKHGMGVHPKKLDAVFRKEFDKQNRKAPVGTPNTGKDEKGWWKQIVRNSFISLVPLKNFDIFFNELYDLFAQPTVWRLYPEVKSVLKKLRRNGFTIGIVSNWDSRLLLLTKKMGLEKYIDFVTASVLVGSAKPDPRIFKEALKKSRTPANRTIHVGDRYKDDYLGAKGVGIYPVLLHRNGIRPRNARTIRSLKELLPIAGLP